VPRDYRCFRPAPPEIARMRLASRQAARPPSMVAGRRFELSMRLRIFQGRNLPSEPGKNCRFSCPTNLYTSSTSSAIVMPSSCSCCLHWLSLGRRARRELSRLWYSVFCAALRLLGFSDRTRFSGMRLPSGEAEPIDRYRINRPDALNHASRSFMPRPEVAQCTLTRSALFRVLIDGMTVSLRTS
jgi:hypothetical protein